LKALTLQLTSKDATKAKAKYLLIANAIREAIKQAQVAPGEVLPSARKLALQLKSNRHTVMAAYAELVAEGWVEAKLRSSYRVVDTLPIQTSIQRDKIRSKKAHFGWQFVRQGLQQNAVKASEFTYNFSGGQPDLALFPFDEFKSYFSQSCQRPKINNLSYGDSKGYPELINQVATYLRRVRSITDKEVMICNGSQEALYIISQLLLQQGDTVAVEQLGYPPAWAAFKSSGAELVAIKQDNKGIIVEHLAQQLQKGKIKLIYLTPLHQYPTTVTLDASRRMKIYQLAAQHNVAIIEDDYDHEFHYKCQPITPMASDDPLGLVIYISTFSKLMFGGTRIGYVAANSTLIDQLARYKALINHKSNVLIQDAVARWMLEGGFESHLRRMTKIYQKRRDAMVKQLQNYQQQGLPIKYQNPDGGMALWVDMGKPVSDLKATLLSKDVYLQTEPEFNLNKSQTNYQFIRLGFAAMDETRASEGLAIIMRTLYSL